MNDLKNEMPEDEAPVEVTRPEHTIGSLLQTARKEKGLSKENVSKTLNLRITLIDEIEADDFSNTASTTYAKGYIKNYARLVSADPFLIKECIEFQLKVDNSPTMQSFSRKTTREATNNRLTWISYIIFIVLIGMFVFWWAQKSSFFSELTDLSKPSQEEQRVPSQNEGSVLPASTNDTSATANIDTSSTELTLQPQTKLENTASVDAPVGINEQKNDIKTPQEPLDSEDENVATSDANPAEITVQTSNTTTQVTASLTEINLQLTENCWIKIEDATGKVLILGEKKAGYNKTVSGTPPFKTTFGAPQAVKLALNGEKLDLSYLPNSRVAHITLPLER